MLPFKNRLTRRRDHEKVQKLGNFISLDNIAIKTLENSLGETRVGIVVGLKYSKKAIERNQTKRVLSELMRTEIKNLKKGLDIVIMARKREEEKTRNINFKKNLAEALNKGNLIKNLKEEQSSAKIK